MHLFLLSIVCLLFCAASSEKLLYSLIGSSFGRNVRDPKYKIEFHSDDSPYHPEVEQESIIMPTKSGEKYQCYLPRVEKPKIGKVLIEQNSTGMILKTEQTLNLKTPDELLESLKDECFMRHEAWWIYELCFQKRLRQFHLENNELVQEYILGVFDADATSEFHENKSYVKDPSAQRYHSHLFTNGTLCDLTNNTRETEVRFICGESRTKIVSITELSTCKYAMVIRSPYLCKHPLFQEEKPTWRVINCNTLHSQTPKPNQISTLSINIV